MIKLRGLKLSDKLRKLSDLRPVHRNDTDVSVFMKCSIDIATSDHSWLTPFRHGASCYGLSTNCKRTCGSFGSFGANDETEIGDTGLQRDNITIADVNCLFEKVT